MNVHSWLSHLYDQLSVLFIDPQSHMHSVIVGRVTKHFHVELCQFQISL